ncbi:MAG: NnrS family protein [Gemmataceae bacterium]
MNRIATLDKSVLIPDLLQAAPQTRSVLDRYGLRGCGGPLGPRESLEFFANAHDIPLDRLLQEIEARMATPAETPAGAPRPADAIYRPFFIGGIAVVLTLGAVWGAYLLLRIAWTGSFTAAGLHEINAHGHAQIFGWVGLFVMGFAYQAFPRFKHTDLAYPRLARATLWLLLAGLVVRSVCEPLARFWPWLAAPAVGAGVFEILAIGLFAWIIPATWRRSGKPLALYDYYIAAALAWFVLQAVYETVYLAATLTADSRAELLDLVATWQGPLREIQIHGFALVMILGVSQRMLHHFYGLPAPNPRLARAALVGLNLAVIGEVAGLVLMRSVGHAWAALWYGSILLLAGTTVALVRDWRIFSPARDADRSLKFVRAAYVWLLVSLAMLVLLPAYQFGLLRLAANGEAATLGFSHAFYGAIRHAITVGFVSLMIVGVAAKVVPTLNGVDTRRLTSLWTPFLLINAGCALRVSMQTLTDFTPIAFPVAGVSGVLEVTGLALWGAHLLAILWGRYAEIEPGSALGANEPITATNRVGDILDRYPDLLSIFLAHGFTPLKSTWARRLLAPRITLSRACRYLGVDEPSLLDELNRARPKQPGRIGLPLVENGSH